MIQSSVIRQRFFTSSGSPLAGGKLYSYTAGTSTPVATYSDSAGTSNANPVVLDASGEANLWLDPTVTYKFVLKDSTDVTQWTVDNITVALTDSSITTAKLAAGAVTTAKLADDAVDSTKLQDDPTTDANRAVTSNHIRTSAVTTAKIADANVTTVKILDANVTTAKLADLSVTQGKLAAKSVASGSLALYAGALTSYVGPGLSATITSTGRPALIIVGGDPSGGTGGEGYFEHAGSGNLYARIMKGATVVYQGLITIGTSINGAALACLDAAPTAGSVTYSLETKTTAGTYNIVQMRMQVTEL